MPRYHVLVAYGGAHSVGVAVDIAKCLTSKGMMAHIAVPGLKESIRISTENSILTFEETCHAILAVGTDGSSNNPKFVEEIEFAKYHKDEDGRYDPIPVVAFLKEKAKNVPLVLTIGCSRVRFHQGQHKKKCKEVAEMVRHEIRHHVKFNPQTLTLITKNALRERKTN